MYHNIFDLIWAYHWIRKYQENNEPKKAKLVKQLAYIQETLDEKSILDTSILISGHYSYDELKSIIEDDMYYKLVYPENKAEHNRQRTFLKFFKRNKFNIKIL